MNIYADAQDELKEQNAEKIEDYILSLTSESASQDMDELFKKIEELDIYLLEEKEVINYTNEIKRLAIIPKIEKEVKELILKISNLDKDTTTDDTKARLELVYSLLSNMEQLKDQTRDLKRDTNKCNEDYKYIFNYLQTTQYLVKAMNKATEYKVVKKRSKTLCPAAKHNFFVLSVFLACQYAECGNLLMFFDIISLFVEPFIRLFGNFRIKAEFF